ncbi:PDGLE domain-containing protein [Nocardioidaceae bacterium]|nr:PDGLE domain-containing protein [Nocardioidaceae bacterium]
MSGAGRRGPSGKVLAAVALVVVLAVAGVLSGFASGSPDGLERVAEDRGFAEQGRESEAIGPFDGYAVSGDDSRVGTGTAGIVGSLAVLGIAGGAFWLLRRRSDQPSSAPSEPAQPARRDA